ncbi:hypothetical protein PT282_01435 [Bifidobacterium sp. ESL0763]|uniref:hypothetical protein n=1 Tax=Bifidobacterium sp. ESL0763 TaxID=2983227 RepID=UPI0023F8D725|nr:hypothetical protein [Bifidobacterium sp. ESL0763]MDF7663344.1 hypothetical protein [Bifidobacterium sp. ESL0763]
MNEKELNERFHITEQEMDQLAEEVENDVFSVDHDSLIKFRPITPEVRASINRAVAYWDAKNAEQSKMQSAGATA